jgi:hypothetical protein
VLGAPDEAPPPGVPSKIYCDLQMCGTCRVPDQCVFLPEHRFEKVWARIRLQECSQDSSLGLCFQRLLNQEVTSSRMTVITDRQAERQLELTALPRFCSIMLPLISRKIRRKERRKRNVLRATGSNCSFYGFFCSLFNKSSLFELRSSHTS